MDGGGEREGGGREEGAAASQLFSAPPSLRSLRLAHVTARQCLRVDPSRAGLAGLHSHDHVPTRRVPPHLLKWPQGCGRPPPYCLLLKNNSPGCLPQSRAFLTPGLEAFSLSHTVRFGVLML